jgi:hypothetical protein
MAVAFVTVVNGAASTTANLVITTSFGPTGTDRALVFPIAIHSTTISVTAVSWSGGGVAGRIASQVSPSGARTELWGITAPTTTTGSAVANLSSSVLSIASLLLYSAADSTNSFSSGDSVFSTSTVANVTLTPANLGANDLSLGFGANIIAGNWTGSSTNNRIQNNSSDPGMDAVDSSGTTAVVLGTDGGMGTGQVSRIAIRVRATVAAAGGTGWGPLIGGQRNGHLVGNW